MAIPATGASRDFVIDETAKTATKELELANGIKVTLTIIFAPGTTKHQMDQEIKKFDKEAIKKIVAAAGKIDFSQKAGKAGQAPYKLTSLTLHLDSPNVIKITKHYDGKADKTIEDAKVHYRAKEDSAKTEKFTKKLNSVAELHKIFHETFNKRVK